MATGEVSTVGGVFDDADQAERAIAELKRAGFRDEQIGFVLRRPEQGENPLATDPMSLYRETGTRAEEGEFEGVAAGATLGGVLGAAAALLIPGIGPAVAGGILAGALGGAAVGASAGGLVGAFQGLDVPEQQARAYEDELRAGRVVVTVRAGNRADEASEILQRAHAAT